MAGHGAWLAVLFCKEMFFFIFFYFFFFFLQIGPPLQCYLYCRMILTSPEKGTYELLPKGVPTPL